MSHPRPVSASLTSSWSQPWWEGPGRPHSAEEETGSERASLTPCKAGDTWGRRGRSLCHQRSDHGLPCRGGGVARTCGRPAEAEVLHRGKEPEGGVDGRVGPGKGAGGCESEPRSVQLTAGLVEGQGGELWGRVSPLSASWLARAEETCTPRMEGPARVGGGMTSRCQAAPRRAEAESLSSDERVYGKCFLCTHGPSPSGAPGCRG